MKTGRTRLGLPWFPVLAVAAILMSLAPAAHASRVRFELERYDLARIRIWNLNMRKPFPFALVYVEGAAKLDTPGLPGEIGMFRVETGDYIGKEHGIIQRIDRCGLWIVELVQDNQGDWIERKAVLKTGGFDTDATCVRLERQWHQKKRK